ncbi:MAG: iron-containing alcohol dehydrogenase [bacterium]|nr:iron-containing alcohol dehydrogenase [bacterium]
MQIPKIIECDALNFLKENTFDIYILNPFSKGFMGHQYKSEIVIDQSMDYDDVLKMMSDLPDGIKSVLAFGAGSVVDPAKYLSKNLNATLTIIPSALSVNSFTTHRSSFFDENINEKRSFDTKAPEVIVLDFSLLETAGVFNTFGIIELSATVTAQQDWELAVENDRDQDNLNIRSRASKLIEQTISLFDTPEGQERLRKIFNCLLESGLLTQNYGTGRPVSGSEHILSTSLEGKLKCAHGVGLYFGIIISSLLHKNLGIEKNKMFDIIPLLLRLSSMKDFIRVNFIKEDVISALRLTTPKEGRFTVLNLITASELQNAIDHCCNIIYQ